MYNVLYVLKFYVKHKGTKPCIELNYPIIIMSPDSSIVMSKKTKKNEHPGFNPYVYSVKELYFTPEEEDAIPYLFDRKNEINAEK